MELWSKEQMERVCDMGDRHFHDYLLNWTVIGYSVKKAIADLNRQESLGEPTNNYYLVLSATQGVYYLVYKKGEKSQALEYLEKLRKASSKGSLVSCVSCFAGFKHLLCDILETRSRFYLRKLIGIYKCELSQRYAIVKQLGAGAMGRVYLVKRNRHRGSLIGGRGGQEMFVAKETQDSSKRGRDEFKREFENMRSLRHPNCLKVLELIESPKDGKLFIISELAPSGDLYQYMDEARDQGELSQSIITKLFLHAMKGVAFLHDQEYCHNDLKPANLLVMDKFKSGKVPRVVVADFGCATTASKMGTILGDPRYLAPECMVRFCECIGDKRTEREAAKSGTKVDIWAMGATLYEVLSGGKLPFLNDTCELRMKPEKFEMLVDAILGPDELKDFEEQDLHVSVKPGETATLDSAAMSLLKGMLQKDPSKRIDARIVLESPWFSAVGSPDQKKALSDYVKRNIKTQVNKNRLRQILLTALASKLHYKHVKRCYEVFSQIDTNNNGTICRRELKEAMNRLDSAHGFSSSLRQTAAADIDLKFDTADVDNNNMLEFNEFAALTLDWSSVGNSDDDTLDIMLRDIGACKNDQVRIDKLAEFCEGALNGDQLQEALAEFKDLKDPDGSISLPYFKKFIYSVSGGRHIRQK